MSLYLKILILAGAFPFLISFYPPLGIYRNYKALLKSLWVVLLIFGTWDIAATALHHWYFQSQFVWPVRIINLPLEEVLFFIVIPFCCIFTWEVLLYIDRRINS